MNIYKVLNETINYIEENLLGEIDYKKIARMFGTSESTMQRVFSLITGITITEYIRKRRLTIAVSDIKQGKKIKDIAYKYGYSSEVSFSRAFEKMHGILPSKVKNSTGTFNMQLVLKFNEENKNDNISYKIKKKKITLYGIKKEVDIDNVPPTAESLWKYVNKNIKEFKTNKNSYGIISTENKKYYYYCALENEFEGSEKICIPESNWFILDCFDKAGKNIKKVFEKAYDEYLPNANFKTSSKYEIEKYIDNKVELYIMIN